MAMGSFLYIMKLLNREKEVNMDENIMYEIYYEGPCGVLKSTGITVENKNAPVEKDPELTIETKGDYLFISKIVLSIIMIALL